jgi:2',3'-cyclic-nucleotide 2'-phosphodiesterase (5'-nucleotidase family)
LNGIRWIGAAAAATTAIVSAVAAWQGRKVEIEAFGPAQCAADVLRKEAGADGAFIAAGLLRDSFQADNLATMLEAPNDELVVIELRGSLVRQAFERSVSLYPQPNASFLQISGFDVVFNPDALPNQRVKSISADGGAFSDAQTYRIAMPVSLARGAYGYFKIWDKTKIVATLPDMTVEKALTGKRVVETRPRWVAQP